MIRIWWCRITKMDFHVPKAQERSDLIAYFKQQKAE